MPSSAHTFPVGPRDRQRGAAQAEGAQPLVEAPAHDPEFARLVPGRLLLRTEGHEVSVVFEIPVSDLTKPTAFLLNKYIDPAATLALAKMKFVMEI
jgi:hypothetical protein